MMLHSSPMTTLTLFLAVVSLFANLFAFRAPLPEALPEALTALRTFVDNSIDAARPKSVKIPRKRKAQNRQHSLPRHKPYRIHRLPSPLQS